MVVELAVSITGDGVWAWMDANPGAIGSKRVATHLRAAHKQAWHEFMTGKLPNSKGIASRFSEGYGQRVEPRSEKYMKRVRRFFGGRYLPFTSPSLHGSEARAGGYMGHLRDNIKQEGNGYRVQARNGTAEVRSRLTLPAARILNFHPQYRSEFLALDTTNRPDGQAIEHRVLELAGAALAADIASYSRRQLRRK